MRKLREQETPRDNGKAFKLTTFLRFWVYKGSFYPVLVVLSVIYLRESEQRKGGVRLRKIAKKSICEKIFAKFNLNIKFLYPFGYWMLWECVGTGSFVRFTGLTNWKQEYFKIPFLPVPFLS